jgi:hypothetical protein
MIFQSGIVKIPSDHQAQDGGAVYELAQKGGAYQFDLSVYHGRLIESNPKVCETASESSYARSVG